MKKQNYLKNQSMLGFTMIEMLLCMGIFSILLIVLLQIFTAILSVHAQSQTTSSIDQEGNYLLSRLSYDIHQADTVISPGLGASAQELQIDGKTYKLIGDNLMVADATGSTQLNGADVKVAMDNNSFTTLGKPSGKLSVKINITLTSKVTRVGGLKSIRTFETTVQTR